MRGATSRPTSYVVLLNGAPFNYNQDFKVTPLFDDQYLRKGTRYRRRPIQWNTNRDLCPTQACRFEWPWVTWWIFSDTKHGAQYLRDSWVSCFIIFGSEVVSQYQIKHMPIVLWWVQKLQAWTQWVKLGCLTQNANKCIGDDTKVAARRSPNC